MAKLCALNDDMTDQELLHVVIDFYYWRLLETPKALTYLQQRDLGDPDLLERFQIGFADRALGLELPSKQLRSGLQLRKRLTRLQPVSDDLALLLAEEIACNASGLAKKIGNMLMEKPHASRQGN